MKSYVRGGRQACVRRTGAHWMTAFSGVSFRLGIRLCVYVNKGFFGPPSCLASCFNDSAVWSDKEMHLVLL